MEENKYKEKGNISHMRVFSVMCIALGFTLLFVGIGIASATTVYVATDGSGDYNCDGIDDQIEINDAINSINSIGGGTVHLKRGTYIINNHLLMMSNVVLEGDDSSRTIVKIKDDTSMPASDLSYDDLLMIYNTNKIANIRIQDIQLDANKKGNPTHIPHSGVSTNCIWLDSTYSTYKNILLKDMSRDGIRLFGHHNDIIDCKGELIGHDAVRLTGNAYSNVINFAVDWDDSPGNNIVRLSACQYCVLDNIRGRGGDTAIQFQSAGHTDCSYNTLKNSILATDSAGAYYGVVLSQADSGSLTGNKIINSIIYDTAMYGVYIDGADNTEIINCVIYNSGYGINGMSGIKISRGSGTTVKNSIISNCGGYGIRGDAISQYCDIWNNTLGNYHGASAGTGDISMDPLFVDLENENFHLKSWGNDGVASPCIDAGDPSFDYSNEPEPNGGRINMGAYGNTNEASVSSGGNRPPTAYIDSITPDIAEQGKDSVSFSGHGTDTDGSVVAYNWRSSMDGQLSTASSFDKSASELSDGTHTIHFKVQDDKGAWSTEVVESLTIIEPVNPPPYPDLVAEWHLDDGSGETAVDSSGNGNDGTLVNNPTWVDGTVGKGLNFDGIDDYIDCGNDMSLNTPNEYTIEMWVYNRAGTKRAPTLLNRAWQSRSNGFFWIYTSGVDNVNIKYQWADGSQYLGVSFNNVLPKDAWTHLAFRFTDSNNELKLYTDGSYHSSKTLTDALPVDDGILYLGTYCGKTTCHNFNGIIGEVKIYNRALSAEEIRADYEAGSTNHLPTAIIEAITPDIAEQGKDTVSFSGHGADTDGSVVAYNWRSSMDGMLSIASSFGKSASELSVGAHTIYFKVQDDNGAWSTEVTGELTIIDPANQPPFTPADPSPSEGATEVSIAESLCWSGGDPDDDDTVTYDVYYGTSMSPPLVAENQPGTTYDPGMWDYNTEYYWRIVATDNRGASTESEAWSFVTASTPDSDLVAEWHLDDGSGLTAVDSSGNGNDGTLVNNPTWVTGKVGKGLSFDGTNDYVDCGQDASLKITGAITVEAWVKWSDVGNQYFVTKTGGPGHRSYDLSGNDDGTVEFRVVGADGSIFESSGTAPIPTGEWVYLVGTYEPSSYVRLFVNGALAEEETTSIPAAQGDNGLSWYIGAREGNQGWFNGVIDEVKIHNGALSAEEIRANYEANPTNNPPAAIIDSITPETAEQGKDTVSFTGHGTDTDGLVVAYTWRSSMDGQLSTASAFSKSASELSEGMHTIYFKVQDDKGAWSTEVTGELTIIDPANQPPFTPADPSPSEGATEVSIAESLCWSGGDPDDDDTVTYDVYYGTSMSPPLVAENQPGTTYDPGMWDYNTEYYWRIVATDNRGASTESEAWSFVTASTPDSDLVAEWHLDDGSGLTAVDSSGNGNDGTLANNPAWVNGKVGKGLSFDGTNDYVDCGHDASLKISGAITVEAWVKWSGGGNPYFVTKFGGSDRRSYDLSGNTDGTVEFRVGGADCNILKSSGTAPIPTGEWVHLVGTYEPSSYVRLFVNGALAEEDTSSIPASQGDNGLPWYLGAREGSHGWFNGVIDEVKIHNGALSAEEVSAAYEAYYPNNPPYTPDNPSPSKGATEVSIAESLCWSGGDPDDDDTVTYDVYYGTSMSPPLVAENQPGTTYDPGMWDYNTEYYWRIVATDNQGASTESEAWSFVTASTPDSDLVAEWHLDDGSGLTAVDSSGNGNDGTLVNNPAWVNGKVGKGLSFDGTNDYVDCGQDASLKITGAITVEAWVKWSDVGNQYFVTKTGGPGHRSYDLSGNDDGTVEFRVVGADGSIFESSGTAPIPTGEWVYLVGTYEPSSYVRLFVNGALAEEETTSIPAAQGDNGLSWYIGAREGNQGWFNGVIDEVAIYNGALSAEEIMANYEAYPTNRQPAAIIDSITPDTAEPVNPPSDAESHISSLKQKLPI